MEQKNEKLTLDELTTAEIIETEGGETIRQRESQKQMDWWGQLWSKFMGSAF